QNTLLRAAHPQPLRAIFRALADIVMPALPKIAVGVVVIPLAAAFLITIFLATGHNFGSAWYIAALGLGVLAVILLVSIIMLVTVMNISLYRGANRARTSRDLLTLFARASMNMNLNLLISRFSFKRVTADPAICGAVECLVGEIERA